MKIVLATHNQGKIREFRKAFAEIPPRVEYSLTELGKSLVPIIEEMIEWANVHFDVVTKG